MNRFVCLYGKKVLLFVASLAAVLSILGCSTYDSSARRQNIAAEYHELAEGFAELGNYRKAAIYFEKAARWPAWRNQALYSRGRMLALDGQWTQAVSVFENLITQDPDNSLVRSALAWSLAGAGSNQKALEHYKVLINTHPDDPVFLRNYAALLVKLDQSGEAVSVIEQLRTRWPGHEALKDIGELEKSIKTNLDDPENELDSATDTADLEAVVTPSTE